MLQAPARPLPIPNLRADGGIAALVQVGRRHGLSLDPQKLHHELGLAGGVADLPDLARAAGWNGLKAKILRNQAVRRVLTLPTPAIIGLRGGSFSILRKGPAGLSLFDPIGRKARPITTSELAGLWTGEVLLLRRASVALSDEQFGLRWFATALGRYKAAIGHILVCSLFVQLFALLTPLLFQVVVDKALVHRSHSTLIVIAGTMIAMGVFEVLLQYLRAYVLAHTSARLDVELGSRLFGRLLRLPLGYFETRATGQTVARVRELENVRNFLTGQSLTAGIDLSFTFVFAGVLFIYSVPLALVVLGSIPVYMGIVAGVRPLLRERIRRRFTFGAASQQFLVESVVGLPTIKAAAVEPLLQREWEERLAAYVRSAFDAGMLANLGQNAIQYVSRVTTALILLLGALTVMDGRMTVGELIAFNMIATQLLAPVLRLAGLWQDFQQIQISVERIGDIYNAEPEPQPQGNTGQPPPIRGAISLEHVRFRYRQDGQVILNDVSLDIGVGEVIGIVGPSGSGKSTLTKLIQRFYVPEHGRIRVDGVDLSQIDPAWLRRQIGVVLQENLLFNRTIHENIALADPAMSRAAVMRAARLAGADEFIGMLPLGYETPVEERGANLSGGQRQRVAIARALARNPRILIFDEATSALDYESERIIQRNMREIVKERTVVIVAHRLAAVRDCDRIIGIDRGAIVEDGRHDDLLKRPNGLYARLWALQSRSDSSSYGDAA